MKTSTEHPFAIQTNPEAQDRCSIAVAYDDTAARQRALALCHHLVQGFWSEIDFLFTWWRFRYLQDPDIIHAAVQTTARADVVLFSTSSSLEPSQEVQDWINLWLPQRKPGDGVLLVLTPHSDDAQLAASPVYNYLQTIARRAQMDCLPRVSPELDPHAPESLEGMHTRAHGTSRILDDILQQGQSSPSLPSHWGINE